MYESENKVRTPDANSASLHHALSLSRMRTFAALLSRHATFQASTVHEMHPYSVIQKRWQIREDKKGNSLYSATTIVGINDLCLLFFCDCFARISRDPDDLKTYPFGRVCSINNIKMNPMSVKENQI